MDVYIAQWISLFGQGTWIDDLSFIWSRWVFLAVIFLVIVISSFLADKKSGKQYIIALFVGIGLFYLCNELLFKGMLTQFWGIRLRPYLAHPELFSAIGSQILDSSFPSSHVASTMTVVSLWIWRQKRLWPIGMLIGVLVALSRVHNGMHYPTDALAGAVFGILYGYLGIQASKLIIKKRPILK